METQAHYARVGFFVLTGLMGTILFALWLSQTTFTHDQNHYDIFFKGHVTGLKEGASVEYRGVPIGTVDHIFIHPDRAEPIQVSVSIDAKIPIKEDAIATLETQGLTGVSYIQIAGSTKNSPPLKIREGRNLAIIPSKSSLFEEVSDSLPQLLYQANSVIKELKVVFNEENQKAFSQILKNIEHITEIFAPSKTDKLSFIGEMNKTMGIIDETLIEIKKTSQDIQGLLNENRSNIKGFSSLGLDSFNKFLIEGREAMSSIRRLSNSLERSPKEFLFHDSSQGVPTR